VAHQLHEDASNPSDNDYIGDIAGRGMGRRRMLVGGLVGAAAFVAAPVLTASPVAAKGGPIGPAPKPAGGPLLGFKGIPASDEDYVLVPPGYGYDVILPWGAPLFANAPAWKEDASNPAADQLLQVGMGHDGMTYFPISKDRGLLVFNQEFTDDQLLVPGGRNAATWTADDTLKSLHAHGVTVAELARDKSGGWSVVFGAFNRRLTGETPMAFSGPAAGHALLKTTTEPTGTWVNGTLNNCANGITPWNTYLTCEENFNGYFKRSSGTVTPLEKRYGVDQGFGYLWANTHDRFDPAMEPNEANRFGWVVEIDPFAPDSKPVKRTALGRLKHEGAFCRDAGDGRVVVYTGDDERFEYAYKFVSAAPWKAMRNAGKSPLDEGTLHVAKFEAGSATGDGKGVGTWVPLVYGTGPLTAANGFADQADVVIKARLAADAVGATKMDRPEWIAAHPATGEVYMTLTNNTSRGSGTNPGVDDANPRVSNRYGSIIRWREAGGDAAALAFEWDIFVLAPGTQVGSVNEGTDAAPVNRALVEDGLVDGFGSPDGLWFDPHGRLWIQTDGEQPWVKQGTKRVKPNDQMLCADPATGEVRRFLQGVRGSEVTGIAMTPDGTAMFVNIQHPGENEATTPADPRAISNWPDYSPTGRPRPATVVIRKLDGGVIGT
jgi:secreted PhoX family phosphatase